MNLRDQIRNAFVRMMGHGEAVAAREMYERWATDPAVYDEASQTFADGPALPQMGQDYYTQRAGTPQHREAFRQYALEVDGPGAEDSWEQEYEADNYAELQLERYFDQMEAQDLEETRVHEQDEFSESHADQMNARLLRAERYTSNEVNDRFMQRADAIEWGEETPGNPPDCMVRDMEIEHYAEKYPDRGPGQHDELDMPRGANGEWTFEDWAETHGYGRDDINFVSDVEERRADVRAGRQLLAQHGEWEFPPGRFEEVGRALRQIEEHRREREPADLERGQLHGTVDHRQER